MTKKDEIRQAVTAAGKRWGLGYGYGFSTEEKRAYKPYIKQRKFHRSGARFKALIGGRGSGKTTAGANEAVVRISRGASGTVLSPDFEHFKFSTWPEFRRWIPWSRVQSKHKRYQDPAWAPAGPFSIAFDNGAIVNCKGLRDPDSARGPNVNWLWYDEGGRDKLGRGWDIAIGGVRVGDTPAAWVTTTPAGRRHWLYRQFVLQDIPDDARKILKDIGHTGELYEYLHATIHDNRANLDPLFYASMLASYQGWFAEQELLGLFVDATAGLVYQNFSPQNITVDAEFSITKGAVEIAFDDGFAVSPRVFLFIQKDDKGRCNVFHELYHTGHLGRTCIQEAKEILKAYVARELADVCAHTGVDVPDDEREDLPAMLERVARFNPDFAERAEYNSHFEIAVGDPSAAELREAFRQEDIPARGAKNDILEGVKKTMNLVCNVDEFQRLIIHPRCKEFIYEMSEGYQMPEGTKSGQGQVKPLKQDDHGCDAIRYWAITRAGRLL